MTLGKNLVLSSFEQLRPFSWHSFLTSFLALFFGFGVIGAVFYLFASDQPTAAYWICLTLWLTVLIAGGALFLLSLGEQD
ncbi:hypothetical protein ACO2Q8_17195 [Larkinella sp. VNQ87]|uniref:hypothetical protein n=1 Tax=Larkinella sp. VNQ87 TaxID=3400921 RepID=UPI003C037513